MTTPATILSIGKWHLGMQWPTKDGKPPTHRLDPRSNVDFTRAITEGPMTRGFDTYFGTDVPNFSISATIPCSGSIARPPSLTASQPCSPSWKNTSPQAAVCRPVSLAFS